MKTQLALLACAVLTACGGGGGGAPEQLASATPQAGTVATSPVGIPAGTPTAPTGTVSVDTVAPTPPLGTAPAPVAAAGTPDLRPSGRSLNWWGTEPQMLFDVQQSCDPKPDCQIPDGDLNVWNQQCPPVGDRYRSQCYVPLSFEPQVRPDERRPLGQPEGAVRPDPMNATQSEIDAWNVNCNTPRCLVVMGVPS